jgi:hypothetical protein
MAGPQSDILIKKADIDRTFSFNKAQWAQVAPQMIAPRWTLRVDENESGAQIIGFDPSTGIGLSIQPLFRDDTRPPDMVIVGNYFPPGFLPPMTDNLRSEIESVARKEIGAAYSLRLTHEIRGNLEVFEFLITEL